MIPGKHVRGIAPGGSEIYMEDNSVFSTGSHQELRTLPFTQLIPSNGFLVSPTGDRLYSRNEVVVVATNQLGPPLDVDITTGSSFAGASIPGGPDIAADGTTIYANKPVNKVDTNTGDSTPTPIEGTRVFMSDIAITPNGSQLLISNYSGNGILDIYDANTYELSASVGIGDFSGEIGFVGDGTKAVVGVAGNPASFSGGVVLVDLTTLIPLDGFESPLADNLTTSGHHNEVFVSTGETRAAFGKRLGVDVLVVEQDATLALSKTFFLGINKFTLAGGRPKYDQIYRIVFKPAPFDFGDVPDSYLTLVASNGARHVLSTDLRMGAAVDSEGDGLPDVAATGDDNSGAPDDEDGVAIGGLRLGRPASVTVSASDAGKLDAFLDFNADGDFADAGEKIFDSLSVAAGSNNLSFLVPSTAAATTTFARFRISTAGGLSFDGLAADGEVEDYQVAILPEPDKVGVHRGIQFHADANGNGQWNGALGGDRVFVFGAQNDVPLAGDWNGDGFDEIGVQRGNQYYLDRNGNSVWDGVAGGDRLYTFRNAGDKPLVGDWDGDGDDEIGSWNAGLFYIDLNSNGVWDGEGAGDRRITFGLSSDTPLAGDWDGDGDDQIGVHRGNVFFLDVNGNGTWNGTIGGDRQITFGINGDTPVRGDWDADGADDIGVRRSNAYYLDANGNGVFNGTAGGDLQYFFGVASDKPLIGRWLPNPFSVTGNDKLGVRRQATDFEDANGNGELETAAEGDRQVAFGVASDVGIAGDWNGDGFDEVGVQRGNQYFLDQNGNGVFDGPDVTATFRNAGDKPLVGDWDGDGDDQLGTWNAGTFRLDLNSNHVWNGAGAGDLAITFGLSSDTPLAGDWNGDGDDDIGVHRGNVFYLDANGNGVWNGNAGGDRQITFGISGDTPVTGDWNGDGIDDVGVKRNNAYFLDANGNGVFNGAIGGDLEYVYGLASDQPLRAKWRPVGALMAAGGQAASSGDAAPLTTDELAPILQQAIILWANTDLNSSQLQTLSSVQVGIAGLTGAQLGQSLGGTILIDRDAAGYGWYVDLESEISNPKSEIPASQSMDLLSAVLHELGHELGFDHDDDIDAMFETLAAGTRRLL